MPREGRALPPIWAAFRRERKTQLARDGMRASTAWKLAAQEARMRERAAGVLSESQAMQAAFFCQPHRDSGRLHFELIGNGGALSRDQLAALKARAARTKALLLLPLAPLAD